MRRHRRHSLALIASLLLALSGITGVRANVPGPGPESGAQKSLADLIEFRRTFGLSTDPAIVARITSMAPEWGVPLTREERSDLAARVVIAENLGELSEYLESVDQFGGMYIDQEAGGTIDIALAGSIDDAVVAKAETLASAGARLRFRSVRFSVDSLEARRAALESLAVNGVRTVESSFVDIRGNRLVIGIGAANRPSVALLASADIISGAVAIEDPIVSTSAVCTNRASCTPYRAGIQLYNSGGTCTSGFFAEKPSGADYLLTAGHCGALNSTWFHDQLQVGTISIRSYTSNTNADAAGILRAGVNHGWVFMSSGETQRLMTSRQGHDADAFGEPVCQSSYVSGLWCGVLNNNNVTVTTDSGVVLNHMRLATYRTQLGDSGGPVLYGNQAKGIVHGFTPTLYCGSYPCSVYSHVWEVEQRLGVTVLTN